ncbi:zinc finger CCCH domain-containing protein 14-like isoform X2 [Tripterygium wilfordii]|uniref:zinc finger CCCH domain-containing protein 14-like isoform X2 n=1 Tax=Tripterygium wilfordii TaxID=458696 RepID=UPI0018F8280C|nr:zinc finger CCCH domain-containing protein 14-like isoform X2 [Tripterygium wilfordii]
MESKEASPPTDPKTLSASSPTTPLASSPPDRKQEFATNFTKMYHSIFPQMSTLPNSLSLTPSPCSVSSSATDDFHLSADDVAIERRLCQARLILEYQELCDHYNLCVDRLQRLNREIDSLRQENNDLRLTNAELIKLTSLSSQPAMQSLSLRGARASHLSEQLVSDFNHTNTIENRFESRRSVERYTLPKSISVRSGGFLQMKPASPSNDGTSRVPSVPRVASQLIPGSRVFVPSKKTEEDAAEFDVYNQGMWKTELCNKWQETGTCPYDDHCQFAHGLSELRPVIRHPRYKTEVCRMVLAGDTCPYGHRCHFRHSLTEQERLVVPR